MMRCPNCGTPDAAPPVCKRCGGPVAADQPSRPLVDADPSRYQGLVDEPPAADAAALLSVPVAVPVAVPVPSGAQPPPAAPPEPARFPTGEILDEEAAIAIAPPDADLAASTTGADAAWFEPGEEILVVRCTRCGAQVDDGGRFCGQCGYAVREARPRRKGEDEGAVEGEGEDEGADDDEADAHVRLRCLYCGVPNERTRHACIQCGTRL